MTDSSERIDGIPLVGVAHLDDHRFLTGLKVAQLPNLFVNPYVAENPALLAAMPMARKFAERRELVQRLMKTQVKKRKNVASYREYIRDVVGNRRDGSMPPIEGWTPEELTVVEHTAYLPWGEQLVAFDSDTQLCCWFDLLNEVDPESEEGRTILDYTLPVVIHYSRPVAWAQQQLHDRNTFGVKMSSSEALERDSYDRVTALTRLVIDATGLRVAFHARQLGAKDREQVTLSAIRQGVLTTLAGRPGIQLGSKPFDLPAGVDDAEVSGELIEVWSRILGVIEPYLNAEGRKATVLPAPSVMAGLGVLAHSTMSGALRRDDVDQRTVEQVSRLIDDVRWERIIKSDEGQIYPWDGIAGKANLSLGRFAVGGAKEYAHAVADALENPGTPRGRKIRNDEDLIVGGR